MHDHLCSLDLQMFYYYSIYNFYFFRVVNEHSLLSLLEKHSLSNEIDDLPRYELNIFLRTAIGSLFENYQ